MTKHQAYEEAKRAIIKKNLTPKEYTTEIIKLAKELEI